MKLHLDNWDYQLEAALALDSAVMSLPVEATSRLVGLGAGDYYVLTLAEVNEAGKEVAWEKVRVDVAPSAGLATIVRGAEGSTARAWAIGTPVSIRWTEGSVDDLRGSAGGVQSVNGQTGVVVLSIPDSPDDVGAEPAGAVAAHELAADPHPQYQTQAEGDARYVQPASLAAVATSGAYADLSGKPAIPATAAEVGAIPAAEKAAIGGVATLDSDGKIPLAQIPATAITDTYVVASQAAQLALSAQVGDVAIRTDINSSFILRADPASTLANWQEILTPAAGGGAAVGSATPQPLGTASPGVAANASREDHVHAMPTAAQVGADVSGSAASAVSTHEAAVDPHTQYVQKVSGKQLSTEDYTTTEKTKLAGIATGATANATDAYLLSRANHTGTQAIGTIDNLQSSLDGKMANPMTTAGDLIVGGTSGAPTRLAKGTDGKFLGLVGGVLSWIAAIFDRYDLAVVASTGTLDLAAGQRFTVDASAPRTLTFSNAPGANRAMTVHLRINGSGAITWPAGVTWIGGSAPTLGTSWTRVTLDWDGTAWIGSAWGSA